VSTVAYPQRISSVHVESIDGELCVYDTARQRVHALNHTAAFVWQRCDGRTTPAELAAALSAEASIDDAEAVVLLTLQELAAAHLLSAPPIDEVARVVSRRNLLGRGVAAAAIPTIYSIVAPTPIDAQSPLAGAPTLGSISLTQATPGSTVVVTLAGTGFIVGATTVTVAGGGVTVTNLVVGGSTSLTASFVIDPAAAGGARTVTVTTAGGTSGPRPFTISPPPAGAPTLTSLAPNQGTRGTIVAVTLTGTNFVGAPTVAVGGGGVTVTTNTVILGIATSLTAMFVIDPAAVGGARTVTVTTAFGTSGPQTFVVIA
jgi:Coenzyme PQQ synthesis protein D (PqqD)